MRIPNVKRFRPFCPVCNEHFTVIAVLPKGEDVNAYLEEVVARHDHKAFQESKQKRFQIRVSGSRQRKSK